MKRVAFVALLVCGCLVATPSANAQTKEAQAVRIVADHDTAGRPPIIVTFHAETEGLTPPLKFYWSLGNGKEWLGPRPLPQTYGVGRYDVVLTVTDGEGRTKRASVAIDSESRGCGF